MSLDQDGLKDKRKKTRSKKQPLTFEEMLRERHAKKLKKEERLRKKIPRFRIISRLRASKEWEWRIEKGRVKPYTTERSAKMNARKEDGATIAKDDSGKYFAFSSSDDVPIHLKIVAIKYRGSWKSIKYNIPDAERTLLRAYNESQYRADGFDFIPWTTMMDKMQSYGLRFDEIYRIEEQIMNKRVQEDVFQMDKIAIRTSIGPPGAQGIMGRPQYTYVKIWWIGE